MNKGFRNKHFFHKFLSIPKTLYINFASLPLRQAIHLPIFVSYSMKIRGIKRGAIRLPNLCERFMVRFDSDSGTEVVFPKKGCLLISSGSLTFFGHANFCAGSRLEITGGNLSFGDGFWANRNLFVVCRKEISFGSRDLIGWEVAFLDDDGHSIKKINDSEVINRPSPIVVKDHVWICAGVLVLKGSTIESDVVIAARSLVNGALLNKNCVYGGSPAKQLKKDISWSVN